MEVWGASTLPSALESSPRVEEEEMDTEVPDNFTNPKESVSEGSEKLKDDEVKVPEHLFVELFAGKGALTTAVRAVGVESRDPDDLDNGGTGSQTPSKWNSYGRCWLIPWLLGHASSCTSPLLARPSLALVTAHGKPDCVPWRIPKVFQVSEPGRIRQISLPGAP